MKQINLKNMKLLSVVALFAVGVAFSACEKIDLKRDNPLDKCKDCNSSGVCIYCDSYRAYRHDTWSVRVFVSLTNSGVSDAKDVTAVFSTTSKYVSSISNSKVLYGNIEAGSSSSYSETFTLEWRRNTPSGTSIPIDIAIEDAKGNKWEDNLSLRVE